MTSKSKQRPVSKVITAPIPLWLLWPLFCQVPSNITATSVSPATSFVNSLDRRKFSLTAAMAAVCTFFAIEKNPRWCIGFGSPIMEQNLDNCSCPMPTARAATTAFTFTAKLSRELPLSYRWLTRLLSSAVTRSDV
uniref:Putative secreted protein synganglion overexpressed n=1 Tax=Rhipicephalus microplus TaxID=6941 RepID=A0A6M2DC96_RHIMP